jgi:hypothetical protein
MRNHRKWQVAICLGALVGLPQCVAGGMMEVTTNSNWRVLANPPADGWNSEPSFDDSTWANATVKQIRVLDGQIVDSIWSPTDSSPIWLRTEFAIPESIVSATLYSVADDDADIYINGQLVLSDHDGVAQFYDPIEVGNLLQTGANVLATKAIDTQGGTAGDFAARLVITTVVPEPAAAQVAAIGLAIVCLNRCRRR